MSRHSFKTTHQGPAVGQGWGQGSRLPVEEEASKGLEGLPNSPPWGQPEPHSHRGGGDLSSRPCSFEVLHAQNSTPIPSGEAPPRAKAFTTSGPVVLGQSPPTGLASQSSFLGRHRAFVSRG